MRYKKVNWSVVGRALLPALAVSFAVVIIGRIFGAPDPVVDRISQVLGFAIFLAACHHFKHRRSEPAD